MDLKELQEQFLKLNWGEAKQKVSERKKENKSTGSPKIMVVQGCPPVPRAMEGVRLERVMGLEVSV